MSAKTELLVDTRDPKESYLFSITTIESVASVDEENCYLLGLPFRKLHSDLRRFRDPCFAHDLRYPLLEITCIPVLLSQFTPSLLFDPLWFCGLSATAAMTGNTQQKIKVIFVGVGYVLVMIRVCVGTQII